MEEAGKGDFSTIHEMVDWVEQSFGIHYTEVGIWKLAKRLKIKKETARPTHVLKDEQASERLKNFPELVSRKTVWFQDEMRFGLRRLFGFRMRCALALEDSSVNDLATFEWTGDQSKVSHLIFRCWSGS